MIVASGPFTADSDLQYRPLQNLITQLKSAKPAVVLLVRLLCSLYALPYGLMTDGRS